MVVNRLAKETGSGEAVNPETVIMSAALLDSMRWEFVERTLYKAAYWRYLDPMDRIVAVILCHEDSAIFSPVYEEDIGLGQYAKLEGAKWVVEQWQGHAITHEGQGTYDALAQVQRVVQYHERQKEEEARKQHESLPDKRDDDGDIDT